MSDQQFRPAHSAFDESPEVKEAAALSLAGKRLDRAAAEALYYGASLHTLAQLAHAMRLRLHPEPIVTYVGDRNINYSNVCVCACRFCAFFRAPESGEGYVITREEMARKIDETLRLGGTQILLQGGHHPDLPLDGTKTCCAGCVPPGPACTSMPSPRRRSSSGRRSSV